MNRFAPALLAVAVLWSTVSQALDVEQRRAEALLQRMCARCHAVGRTGASPNELAPAFRHLGENKLYDPDFTQRLQEGYSSIHRAMPTARFGRDDAEAVVSYLRAIQEPRKPK
ncbi:mono/diheme cytochrome c family protein [Bradyrhizobium sp. cir1]|uniref:c-type cytochrome n=1 Tax=Bradyrhizobium sp. cir1 TaxID=1445730 RepID=UPI0016062A1D|nr:cytochrome c [Bradyrhizobium sp. cir1]MBB4371639.1 mono/diheme cytochrome c family protein [Bradyrhizobium sp. cir1]